MRRVTGVLGATALVGVLVAGSASSASTSEGSGPSKSHPPWIPYQQADLTYPAGTYCEFEVFSEVLHDREYYKNVSTHADGTPRTQLWKGPLILRITNTETGASVDRNASGRAIMQYGPGESFESLTIQSGHFLGGARAGSEPAQGIYYMSGRWSSMSRNDDGSSTFFLGPRGSAENLCDTLAP
jgi:hypothetical protein